MVRMVVSGRFRARANEVKGIAVSPRPCSNRRIFGGAFVVVSVSVGGCDCGGGGGVMVSVRCEGKSAWEGDFFIFLLLLALCPSGSVCLNSN